LTTVEETKTLAGEIGKQQQGTILDYAWKLKKRGLAEGTIKNRTYRLNTLIKRGADLTNPDSVETVLATEKWTPSNKSDSVAAYRSFTKTFNIPWTPIKVRYEPKQPFIPLESEIDQLIAGCGKRTATFLQVLKDTGARAGEATKLQWTDVNSQNNTISINDPEKGSKSRTVKVSAKTISMINAMSKKYGNYIFNPRVETINDTFWSSRMRVARTLQNPRLLQIHFHTLRHFKATMEYHRTRNILYVKQLLGHKRLENTEIYTHLIEFENDEYHIAHAKSLEEEDKLPEEEVKTMLFTEKTNNVNKLFMRKHCYCSTRR
jgi:integrase